MSRMTNVHEEGDKVKKEKEILVVQEQGVFTFPTGDTYDGFFEAKKKDRSVKMHGPGTYTTAEGDVYEGIWDSDKLGAGQEVTITFISGAKYEGFFSNWGYNGPGKYTYPDGAILTCNFIDNCPNGSLKLTDPNGHTWKGKADSGFVWLDPVNHYYEILDSVLVKTKIKRRRIVPPPPPPLTDEKGKKRVTILK